MSDLCRQEIARTLRAAAESGDTLFVAIAAKEIASLSGTSAHEVATVLTEAAIKAGLTVQFGSPD